MESPLECREREDTLSGIVEARPRSSRSRGVWNGGRGLEIVRGVPFQDDTGGPGLDFGGEGIGRSRHPTGGFVGEKDLRELRNQPISLSPVQKRRTLASCHLKQIYHSFLVPYSSPNL